MEKTGSKLTNLSDIQLIELALINNQGAFYKLLEKYREPLLTHILKYVSVKEDAEDICQKSFEKAFMNIDRYDSKYAFSTWLYSIAQNEAIDHIRKNKAAISSVSLTTDPKIMSLSVEDTPEDKVIIDQAVSELLSLICNLPEGYREVAELRFIKDYAYEDIAEELKIPVGTVKTRINRAKKMLTDSTDIFSNGRDN
ncbi:MAG: RNA polymerase sigma factor [Bacteroidales bacterium]|nr:RNA polymerase sigma factor [Bacteroidales bacterium]MDD4670802.1 RNA polymerase sigma factor [Bacteroidales bacterium]